MDPSCPVLKRMQTVSVGLRWATPTARLRLHVRSCAAVKFGAQVRQIAQPVCEAIKVLLRITPFCHLVRAQAVR